MRKTAKYNRIMKIAALGLASVLAFTALPMRTFAEGESEQPAQPITIEEAITITNELSADDGSIANAVADINTAEQEVKEVQDALKEDDSVTADSTLDNDRLDNVQENLEEAKTEAGNAGAALQNDKVDEKLANATKAQDNANQLLTEYVANEQPVQKLDEALDKYDTADAGATGDANNAISNAYIANTSGSEEEATNARDNAYVYLGEMEKKAAEATKELKNAQDEIDDINKQIEEAKKLYTESNNEFTAAKNALSNEKGTGAEDRAKKAEEAMERAQANMDALAERKTKLQEIADQSYAMMVYYYNMTKKVDKKDENGKVVLDENGKKVQEVLYTNTPVYYGEEAGDLKGTLNIEASAENETNKANIDNAAKNLQDNNIFLIGRNYTKLLIEYMVYNDKSVDPGTVEFQYGAEGVAGYGPRNEKMQEGEVYKKNGVDQTRLKKGTAQEVVWNKPANKPNDKKNPYTNEDGRSNFVLVTYMAKNEAGELEKVERRFNYVFKQESDVENGYALENGVVYLAEIGKDGTVTKCDTQLDNYQYVLDALKAEEETYTNQLKEAQKAVDDALADVNRIRKQIDEIKKAKVDEGALTELNQMLKEALGRYEETKKKKDILDEKVEEARKAVAGIDLSRFNENDITDDDDDDSGEDDDVTGDDGTTEPGGTPAGGQPAANQGGAQPQVLGANRPNGGQGTNNAEAANNKKAGVLGANRDLPETAAATDDEQLEADLQKKIEEVKNNSVDKELVTIAEDEVAKAKTFDTDGTHPNWWWLLLFLIVLIGLILKKKYDDHRRKVKAGSQTTVNQSNRK